MKTFTYICHVKNKSVSFNRLPSPKSLQPTKLASADQIILSRSFFRTSGGGGS